MKRRLLLGFALLTLFSLTGCASVNRDLKRYETRRDKYPPAAYVLPELDELPDYENIDYQYRHIDYFIFGLDTILLVVTYDTETYPREKNRLDEEFEFLDHTVYSKSVEGYLMPEYEFLMGSFTFRVLSEDGTKGFRYPKYFGIIGTSDETSRIAYLYFNDEDLDLISDDRFPQSMADFMRDHFNYQKW